MSCDAQCQEAKDFCTGYDIWFQNPKNIEKKSMKLINMRSDYIPQPPLSSSPQFLLIIILLHCAGLLHPGSYLMEIRNRWACVPHIVSFIGTDISVSCFASHFYTGIIVSSYNWFHCFSGNIQNLHSNDTGHYNTQMMPQLSNVSKLVRVVRILPIETPIFQGRFLILYAMP